MVMKVVVAREKMQEKYSNSSHTKIYRFGKTTRKIRINEKQEKALNTFLKDNGVSLGAVSFINKIKHPKKGNWRLSIFKPERFIYSKLIMGLSMISYGVGNRSMSVGLDLIDQALAIAELNGNNHIILENFIEQICNNKDLPITDRAISILKQKCSNISFDDDVFVDNDDYSLDSDYSYNSQNEQSDSIDSHRKDDNMAYAFERAQNAKYEYCLKKMGFTDQTIEQIREAEDYAEIDSIIFETMKNLDNVSKFVAHDTGDDKTAQEEIGSRSEIFKQIKDPQYQDDKTQDEVMSKDSTSYEAQEKAVDEIYNIMNKSGLDPEAVYAGLAQKIEAQKNKNL